MTKNKIVVLVLVLGVILVIGEYILSKKNANSKTTDCSPEATAIMDTFLLGEQFESIVAKVQKYLLKYTVWRDGEEIIDAGVRSFSGPGEILITATEERRGVFVARKDQIRLSFDKEGKVVSRNCAVVFTGP
jgi:uncharacterized membrane protein